MKKLFAPLLFILLFTFCAPASANFFGTTLQGNGFFGTAAEGTQGFVGPGDVTQNAFSSWWSCTRAYSSRMAGTVACDLQRTSDNATCIGVKTLANGNLDVALGTPCGGQTVNAFCAATVCKVIKEYDQASGLLPLTSASLATSPVLSFNGVNGQPSATCSTANATLLRNTSISFSPLPATLVAEAVRTGDPGNFDYILATGGGTVSLLWNSAANGVLFQADGTIGPESAPDTQAHSLIGVATGDATSNFTVQGTNFVSTLASTQISGDVSICGAVTNGQVMTGYVPEAGIILGGLAFNPTGAALALNMDTYYVLTNPLDTPHYICKRSFWVNAGGSSANGGTNPTTDAWAKPSTYYAKETLTAGDCINLVAGNTYTDNFLLPQFTGGSNSTVGWIVIRSVDTNGNPVRGTTAGAGQAKLVSALDDGSPVIGTSISTASQSISFIVVDGPEVTCHAAPTNVFEAGVSFVGVGSPWGGLDAFGPNHIAVQYSVIHDCPSGGISQEAGDFYTSQHNTIYNTSWGDPFATSGISYAQMRHRRNVPPTGRDAVIPWKNLVTQNIVYNVMEWGVARNPGNPHTDGEGFIGDDCANAQGAGSGPSNTNAGLYWLPSAVIDNVFFQNGGNGVQLNDCSYFTAAYNTSYGNMQDLANLATTRAEIAFYGGFANQGVGNIAVTYGPTSNVTQSLGSPGTTLHVANVVPWSEAGLNNGNFVFTVITPSPTTPLPTIIGAGTYNVTGYTVDVSNACPSFPGCPPGGISGTLTTDSAISVADGAQFNNVVPYGVNSVANGCTGPNVAGRVCQYTSFNQTIVNSPNRGDAQGNIQTCSGLVPGGCTLISINMAGTGTVLSANLTSTQNGGGGFAGQNFSPVSNAAGGTATILGNNIAADPGVTSFAYAVADAAAGTGDAQGPGWLSTSIPPPPPNFALLPASPGIGAGATLSYPANSGFWASLTYYPETDIAGNRRNQLALDIGAYAFTGSPLNFVGVADVANAPSPLIYGGTVAATKRAATGRQPAFAINCNVDPTTSYVVYINTSGVLDDAAVEAVCPGYEAGTNIVHVSRVFEQIFNQRECDLPQPTAATQPTLSFNLVSNKSVLKFSGSQFSQLAISNSDPFCGVMFAQPSYLTVAESTFGASISAVLDNGGGDGTLGFGSATTGYWVSEGVTLTPTGIDQSHYFSLFGVGVGNALPIVPGTTGFIAIDSPSTGTTTSSSYGSTIWQNLFTWGRQQSGASFTGVMVGTTTLTVTNVTTGIGASVIKPGQTITAAGLAGGTTILTQLTGTIGGAGDYQLSASATFSAEPVTSSFTGNAFTGFSPLFAIYGTPVSASDPNPQVRAVALTQAQAQTIYTSSLKPNFGLP